MVGVIVHGVGIYGFSLFEWSHASHPTRRPHHDERQHPGHFNFVDGQLLLETKRGKKYRAWVMQIDFVLAKHM